MELHVLCILSYLNFTGCEVLTMWRMLCKSKTDWMNMNMIWDMYAKYKRIVFLHISGNWMSKSTDLSFHLIWKLALLSISWVSGWGYTFFAIVQLRKATTGTKYSVTSVQSNCALGWSGREPSLLFFVAKELLFSFFWCW